ncbi:molybdopterin adenylyltransferase [Salmonella enterica subsp. enterica serovar Montevideo]|nr:molybdopterin adenylyltransferase [Salmonella enterica subsp. enterica serovar Montevideo]
MQFILRRLGLVIPTFIGITLLTFAFVHMIPGDPVMIMAGERGIFPERHAQLLAEQEIIEQTLCELVDEMSCHLVLTTGGTGPARRDVTPDATLAIADREMPGFGEQMRQISLRFVPTAILSRQVGVIRKQALILNLPGQPKSIKETLEGVKADDGSVSVPGIFASVPYCIQLLDGPYVETAPEVVAAFRPKSARRENMSS